MPILYVRAPARNDFATFVPWATDRHGRVAAVVAGPYRRKRVVLVRYRRLPAWGRGLQCL